MLKLTYPWENTPKGCGFFVPSLEPDKTREELRVKARGHKGNFNATTGILHGMLGVLVIRTS